MFVLCVLSSLHVLRLKLLQQSDVQGTGLSKPEASVTSGKACIPDAVASSSRRTAPTLIKPPLSDTWTDIEYSSDPELELKKVTHASKNEQQNESTLHAMEPDEEKDLQLQVSSSLLLPVFNEN